jgi:hypothetical protein
VQSPKLSNNMLVFTHLVQNPVHQVGSLETIFTQPLLDFQSVYLIFQLLHPVVEDAKSLSHTSPLLNLCLE